MACLDTNVLIDLGKVRRLTHAAAMAKVSELLRRGETICTTRLNVAELWYGIEAATDRASELQQVQDVLDIVTVLELDETSAIEFGRLQARLRSLGRPTGIMDALIAAVCLNNGQTLVTRNTKHFTDIAGLDIKTY